MSQLYVRVSCIIVMCIVIHQSMTYTPQQQPSSNFFLSIGVLERRRRSHVFSCEGAALEVLMYVCLSVCLSVTGQVEILKVSSFQKVPEGYRMFQRVTECSKMFQNIPECSRIFQNSRIFQKVTVACMQLQ